MSPMVSRGGAEFLAALGGVSLAEPKTLEIKGTYMHDEVTLNLLHLDLVSIKTEMQLQNRITQKILDEHHLTLYGDGNGNPGLRVRTDRIEQKGRNRDRQFWAVGTAALAGLFGSISNWLKP